MKSFSRDQHCTIYFFVAQGGGLHVGERRPVEEGGEPGDGQQVCGSPEIMRARACRWGCGSAVRLGLGRQGGWDGWLWEGGAETHPALFVLV